MKRVECSAVFGGSIDKLWKLITDNTEYGWRSDLSKIAVSDGGNHFIEYTKDGYQTEFTVTLKIPHERYEFDMKNSNMAGHWTGIFTKVNGRVKITFIEEVEVKNPVMRLFAGGYLKKQQKRYIEDLKSALGENKV